MKFILAVLLSSAVSAMSANSRIGRSLLENARALKENQYAYETTWMTNYTIHFDKCHAFTQVYSIDGNQQGGNNNNKNSQVNRVFTQYMAEFSLCPASSTCKSGCSNGGKYVMDLGNFVQAYVEGRQQANMAACETARANCAYNDVSVCYANAGLEFCYDQQNNNGNNNNNQFNIADYMQCQALENRNYGQNNNNNNKDNNGNNVAFTQYYLGPYCSGDGKAVKLGVFFDAGCSIFAPSDVYETLYGTPLPYSDASIMKHDCLTCNNGAYDATDMCKNAYGSALGRCESQLYNGATQDTSGCNYINNVLPAAAKNSLHATRRYTRSSMIKIGSYVTVAFFGLLSICLAIYSFMLYNRLKRVGKVAMSKTVHDGVDDKPQA